VAIALSSLLSLIAIEVALRLYERLGRGETAEEIVEFSSSLHHRLTPNARMRHRSVEFDYWWINNSLGMRDRERAREKAPGTFRILFLGDSMIAGHGVSLEESASILLEGMLNEPAGAPEVEVVNAGVFSYSPVLEYLYLSQIIEELSPDVVLAAFTLANDVGDDHYYAEHAEVDADGRIVRFDDEGWPWSRIVAALEGGAVSEPAADGGAPPPPPGLASGLKSLLRDVRMLRRLKDLWEGYQERSGYRERRKQEFAFIRERLNDIDYNLGLVNYEETDPAARKRYWRTSTEYLGRIVELVRAHDAECVLVVVPPMERLIGVTELDEPYELLEVFGREHAVPVIQLLPAFLREPPEVVYYEYDRHWTARGNEVAARVIREELHDLGILPEPGDEAE
jgi:hypothetical protein